MHEEEIMRLNEENVKFKLIISVIILVLSLIQKGDHNHDDYLMTSIHIFGMYDFTKKNLYVSRDLVHLDS